jgi:hypothetical protein
MPSESELPSVSSLCSTDSNFTVGEIHGEAQHELNLHLEGPCRNLIPISPMCNSMPDLDEPPEMLPPVSECYCPSESPSPIPRSTATLEMSCEAAARILAELHGDADSARARADLGCTGASSCLVKNTKLLQLIDGVA